GNAWSRAEKNAPVPRAGSRKRTRADGRGQSPYAYSAISRASAGGVANWPRRFLVTLSLCESTRFCSCWRRTSACAGVVMASQVELVEVRKAVLPDPVYPFGRLVA